MKKRILVIDDSALMRRVVCDIISSDDRFEVVGTAANGEEGLELLKTATFDAAVMDVVMPKMTGTAILKELQKEHKHVRIMVFSSLTTEGAEATVEALELGAVDFMHKPSSIFGAQKDDFAKIFLDTLYAVSVSRMVLQSHMRVKMEGLKTAAATATPAVKAAMGSQNPNVPVKGPGAGRETRIVAIASSTGGPKALQAVIPYLPENLAAPVVIVQHMPAGFTASLAARLDETSKLHVLEAAENMEICAGNVYIAPGEKHLHIVRKPGGGHAVHLTDGPRREGVKPCANFMYESIAECGYQDAVCVVMTGMGADGTEGISNLKQVKKIYTITQDQSSCAVYGMPRAAFVKGLSDQVEPLENLASAITKQVGVK